MQPSVPVPTDNVYKFVALLGLALTIAAALGVVYHNDQYRTGCEFYVAQKLLAWAKVEDHSCLREWCGQKNAWSSMVECEAGMRVIAAFFGPCASWALTSPGSVFSHYFKSLDRFAKLATSSVVFLAPHRFNLGPNAKSVKQFCPRLVFYSGSRLPEQR
jgi:hypothetical protein